MLSVLIVNWNTRDPLRRCLRSLSDYPPQEPHEIIVIDNDSLDGSAEMVRTEFPSVRLHCPGKNTGYAAGNNLAFGMASGEFLLTLNPDTEFIDGSMQTAIDELRRRPNVGALSIQFILPDGSIQASVRGFPTVAGIAGDLTGLSARFPHSAWASYRLPAFDYQRDGPAPQPMGTFLLFRREALAAVGDPAKPFDEDFPIYFNEVDLLYRMAQAGWPCWYIPHARVRHLHGSSTKQVRKSSIWESHRSLVRYFRKHHAKGMGGLILPFLAMAAYLAAFVRAKGYHAGFRP